MRLVHLSTYLLILSFSGLNFAHFFGFGRRHRNFEDFITRRHHGGRGRGKAAPPFLFFTNKLNHFPVGKETWKQRYQAEPRFYGNNGIVFLYVSGEWVASENTLTDGTMFELAKKYKAFMFSLEHRFYGESKPLPDTCVESLKYLSVDQAIADTAYFITEMNKEHKFAKPRWIIFGGSYAGTLAHWVRFKHPELVYAAVASSAPLLAKVDFPEYLEHVHKVLHDYNPNCTEAIRIAYETMIAGCYKEEERKKYEKLFKLCDPLVNNEQDIEKFLVGPSNIISTAVQYDEKDVYKYTDVFSIRGVCSIMTNETIKDPLLRLAQLSNLALALNYQKCTEHVYKKGIAEYRQTAWASEVVATSGRQWFWQTCTEFGWYQNSEKKGNTFGWKNPVKMSTDQCADIFGPTYNAAFTHFAVKKTNMNYHALTIPVSRVLSVHGSVDPWSEIGITKNPPAGTFVIIIKGASHCADMRSEDPKDVPDLKRERGEIAKIVGDWVNAP